MKVKKVSACIQCAQNKNVHILPERKVLFIMFIGSYKYSHESITGRSFLKYYAIKVDKNMPIFATVSAFRTGFVRSWVCVWAPVRGRLGVSSSAIFFFFLGLIVIVSYQYQ